MWEPWIEDLLGGFAAGERAHGLADSTIRHRGKQVARYLAHVGEARWAVADHHDVEGWLDSRELGTSALGRAISDVTVFYRWARREDLTAATPAGLIERPRRHRAVPRPAPDGVVLRALRQPDPRLAAAIALMAYGGLRCCEVSRATVGDIDHTAEAVYVTGKGGHTRWVPIVAPMVPYLARLQGLEPGDPIVPRQDGRPGSASPARISQRVSGWLRECAGGQAWTAHQLRHWYAGQALERTGRLDLVQLLLGHQSIATTQIYAAVPASWAHHLRDVWPD